MENDWSVRRMTRMRKSNATKEKMQCRDFRPSTPCVCALRPRCSPSFLPSSVLRPQPSRVAVSSLTFDHTNPRLAQLKPDCHRSFDGDIRLQMIYGKRRTIGMRDSVTVSVTLCQLFDRWRPFEAVSPSTLDFTPKHQIDETGLPQHEGGRRPGEGARAVVFSEESHRLRI